MTLPQRRKIARALDLAAPRLLTPNLIVEMSEDDLAVIVLELQEVVPGSFGNRLTWRHDLLRWYQACRAARMEEASTTRRDGPGA